ncbi:unnamed protein product [Rhodiola kirilowii]
MDPCPFVRIVIGNLALKFPTASKPTFSGVHPSSSPCYCKIKFKNFTSQTTTIPLILNEAAHPEHPNSILQSASFTLPHSDIIKLSKSKTSPLLKIDVYKGKSGSTLGLSSGKLLGRVSVPLDLNCGLESKGAVFQNGWVAVGDGGGKAAQMYLSVKAEPDPRFVFEFGGEPECSPLVFQVQGSVKQPVFTCKFSLRDNNFRSRSSMSESSVSRTWLSSFGQDQKENSAKERKGWSITIHDLSGSPVAAASMVTPFVPTPGSDRVSRTNPGAWLILRPSDATWKPWGRLEAWLERGHTHTLGYRFDLLPDATGSSVAATMVTSSLNVKDKEKFLLDNSSNMLSAASPSISPRGSGDYSSWHELRRGFVMSSTAGGKSGGPEVEVGVKHVSCTEDAAAFVALAAAVDLSVDACKLFTRKLRKELRGAQLQSGHGVV